MVKWINNVIEKIQKVKINFQKKIQTEKHSNCGFL